VNARERKRAAYGEDHDLMGEQHTGLKKKRNQQEPMLIDVLVREPHRDSPVYTWDVQLHGFRLTGIYRAKPGLPADLAIFHVGGQLELPVLLLHSVNVAPQTYVQARLLGALSADQPVRPGGAPPAQGWVFIAAAQVDVSLSAYPSLDMLPATQLAVLKAYLREQAQDEQGEPPAELEAYDAQAAAHLIRETRLFLKRQQHTRPRANTWLRREEERPVAWRAIEGLSESVRLALQHDARLAQGQDAPHAQAEQLIRFVPQRFQHALARLLLDDERLLAFIERPLLRQRTGLLGIQTRRSNEGLFLLTDRQALWLRDFQAPGNSFMEGGYIARVVPLERLREVAVLLPGSTPGQFAGRLERHDAPYQRLVLEVASAVGTELITIEFPPKAETGAALTQLVAMLRGFLPLANGHVDRRLRRLPLVEQWMPQGAEAEQLTGLGGFIPPLSAERLQQRLTQQVTDCGEQVLIRALVPALPEFKTPTRLIALTHQALLVIDESEAGRSPAAEATEQVYRYALDSITSAQLRYSLLGSGLSIFVPQADGRTQQHSFPFNSPVIAWFLPLFTRLRLLLSRAYHVR
jgi:hypothetical protein